LIASRTTRASARPGWWCRANREAGASQRVEFLARGRDGIEVSMRFVHVWTVREGQIVRFRGFGTFDEALEAVGLQE
jgi:ketosteroid isomerase-like protein